METGLSPAPETAAPTLHNLSNHSGAESPMVSNRSTGDVEKAGERQALQGELNTSQNVLLGMGLERSGQVDCPTDESSLEGSNQADNRVELVLLKDMTLENYSIRTEKDQNNDAVNAAVHSEDVATGLSEEAARGTFEPSAGKDLKEVTNGTEFELPKEVTTAPNDHYVGPMSPMTPDTLRATDECNRTMDLEPAVSEAIAGLSPILATRKSDYCTIKWTPSEPRVDKSESSGTAKDAPHGPTSPSTNSSADGLLSQVRSYGSDQDQALMDGQSTQAPEDEGVDTTGVCLEVTEPDEINDPQDVRDTFPENLVLGTNLATINSAKDAKRERMRSLIPTHDVESSPELEQAATHFGVEHDAGTPNPDASLEADVVSSQASNTSEEDEAKHLSSSSSIGDMESHSELEQAATHFGGNQVTVTPVPKASLEVYCLEVDDERIEELESSSMPSRHIDSSNPSEPTSRDSFDSVENGSTQLESSRTYRDLTSAKKHLDASSLAFIERLRGAAHRRKLQVARSRDSLAAKERQQLLSIASAKERQLVVAPELPFILQPAHNRAETSVDPYKPFKARPVPNTTGHFGSGGQVGVPKVEKKPTTTPFSPLLGARRPRKEGNPSVVLKVLQSHHRIDSQSLPFKARPAPPTTGYQGHGGQVGVPKIPKRPPTVPESPSLGKKRTSLATTKNGKDASNRGNQDKPALKLPSKRHVTNAGPFVRLLSGSETSKTKEAPRRERLQREATEERKSRAFRARPLPVFVPSTVISSSPLLGLQILNKQQTLPMIDSSDSENVEPQVATPRNLHSGIAPFEPHSTTRAKKRALFDERRASNEIVRQEEQQRVRQSFIKQTKKELSKLRDSLR